MPSIQVNHVSWLRPGGTPVFDDVSFRIGDGEHAALVGANGAGKSTLVRLICGDDEPAAGTIGVDGRLGVMRQLVGSIRDATTIRDLLVGLSSGLLVEAGRALIESERAMAADPDDVDAAMAYATAIGEWGAHGGYEAEQTWDAICRRTVGVGYDELASRPVATFSGGEQKKFALNALLMGDHEILLLDEPDNFLDIPSKRWLEEEIRRSDKTILFVSHDRELLAACATKIVTIETNGAWTHGATFETYHAAREAHRANQAKDAALYHDEKERLEQLVAEMKVKAKMSMAMAPKLRAAESRLRLFLEKNEEPELVREQNVRVRLGGQRTGKRVLMADGLELHGLTDPFDLELWYGERVAVLGPNGAGKSHFLRLLAGDDSVEHDGDVRLGAGVVPGHFNQTHDHPDFTGRTLRSMLEDRNVNRGPAMGMLRRYELHGCAEQEFETLSGGQQARFQILLLELSGATLLLLDEPTDNLDLESAEALETGLDEFTGTVVAVTHDRWFLRGFDRFVVFDDSGAVTDHMDRPAAFR